MTEDEDGFLSLASPFSEFQFNNGETVVDYINQIALPTAEGAEFSLGIHNWQDRFHPETPLHIYLQVLRLLAPADQEKETEVEHDPQ